MLFDCLEDVNGMAVVSCLEWSGPWPTVSIQTIEVTTTEQKESIIGPRTTYSQ